MVHGHHRIITLWFGDIKFLIGYELNSYVSQLEGKMPLSLHKRRPRRNCRSHHWRRHQNCFSLSEVAAQTPVLTSLRLHRMLDSLLLSPLPSVGIILLCEWLIHRSFENKLSMSSKPLIRSQIVAHSIVSASTLRALSRLPQSLRGSYDCCMALALQFMRGELLQIQPPCSVQSYGLSPTLLLIAALHCSWHLRSIASPERKSTFGHHHYIHKRCLGRECNVTQ